jgi:putative membrane protein
MGWMSVWMLLGLVVFLAAVAGAVYLGVQLTQRDDEEEGAQDVLDRRFAAGEIDAQEYAERRSTLRGDPPPGA